MAPLQLDFITSDVFTTERYAGNPLGIVRVPKTCSLSQEQKLLIAREFNLSETTFLHEKDGDKDVWTVDIFMTTKELPFAGHPTIGTACYILSKTAEERGIKEGVIEASFNLKAGLTGLRYDVAKRVARAAIPHDVHIHKKAWTREELLRVQPALAGAFHQSQIQVKGNFPIVSIVKGMTFVLIELESEEALKLLTIPGHGLSVDGLDKEWSNSFVGTYFFVRTGRNAQEITLRTRMIEGTIEDPATGSAASDLAAYLSIVEGKPGETLRYAITQGVEMGRRSEISIEVVMAQDNGITRLYLEGSGVEVMEGRLTI